MPSLPTPQGPTGLSRRVLALLTAVLLAALIAGAALFGLSGHRTAGAQAGPDAGCTQRTLRFGFTDDVRVVNRQRAYERRLLAATTELPPPRFFTHPIDSDPALHTVTHGFVLIYYRAGLSDARLSGLRALQRLAVAQKVPMIVAPTTQPAAIVGLRPGMRMACSHAGPIQGKQLRAFAATAYPSLKSDRRTPPEPAPDP